MIWTILSWVMSAVALAGTVINAERNKFGFFFWVVSNLYMVVRFTFIKEYAQATLFFIYFLLAIRGIYSWSKKEKSKNDNEVVQKYVK